MAWTFTASRGTAGNNTDATTMAMSPSAAIPVDAIAVVVLSTDNQATTDGNSNEHSSVADTDSHTWTKLYEWTETSGSADDGVTTSLWATKVTSEIGTGDTVTVTLATSAQASAMGIAEFAVAAGKTFSAVDQEGHGLPEDDAVTVTISGLSSGARLWLAAVGLEARPNRYGTEDADYTQIAEDEGGTGGDLTRISFSYSFRIATLTGDTYAQTLTAPRDHVEILIALDEVDDGPAEGTASGTGSGTGAATGLPTHKGTATGTGSGTGAATGIPTHKGTASGTGSGAGSATGVKTGTASGTGSGAGAATGVPTHKGTATGTGSGTGAATGVKTGTASGTGSGTGAATGVKVGGPKTGTASGTGSGTGAATGIPTHKGTATGTGSGTGAATGVPTHKGTATGTGSGAGAATGAKAGTASGTGSGTGAATGLPTHKGTATGTGSGAGAATGLPTHKGAATGTGSGTGAATGARVGGAPKTGTAAGVGSGTGAAFSKIPDIPPMSFRSIFEFKTPGIRTTSISRRIH